jgi:hypothetical protein
MRGKSHVAATVAIALTLQVAHAMGNPTPLEVVNKRMEAHNTHDLETFLSVYSDDIRIYDYPDVPIGAKGKAHMRSIFEPLFRDGAVAVKIHHQIEHGRYVVNQETVTRRGKVIDYVSIYEVVDGLITNVRFLRK